MKFMKLGSKPDTFQNDGDNIRYLSSELASDMIVVVGDVKFYLHKFPLLSKTSIFLNLSPTTTVEGDQFHIPDLPGGPPAFEICAKFCYGITVTLNAYNVVSARCAAQYLGMHESIEKGNLIYKIDVFLNSTILRTWKDSIILLQSTTSLLPLPDDDLKVINQCIDSIASKASIDVSRVDWSYSYGRNKLPEEDNGIKLRHVPKDWWIEELCELQLELFKRVIMSIKTKGIISNQLVGQALKAYTIKRVPGFAKGVIQYGELKKLSMMVNTIVWLLPSQKNSVSCSFLMKLLKATNVVDSGERAKTELITKIGQQLEEASVNDLLIRAPDVEITKYDVDTVKKIVEEFVMQEDQNDGIQNPGILLNAASKLMVAKLVDGYLTEVAKDSNLSLSKFVGLAEMVSGFSQPSHDGLYRAIDMFLKEHPGISKNERKKICRLMDCKKLSTEACAHAVQNERLPMRVIVQVLFFEQARAMSSLSGNTTPDLPKCIKNLNSISNGSSRTTTTNTDEDWDALATAEELKALKDELPNLRFSDGGSERSSGNSKNGIDKANLGKVKGSLTSKKSFTKLWLKKGGQGEKCGSASSDSP